MTGATVVRIVDDDDEVRQALRRLLELSGRRVREYASAGAYLLAAPDDAPGCLVLDLLMPGPSGLDLQEALRAGDRQLPVIFLTGHGDVPSTVRAMRGGAVDFLEKPVDPDAFLAAVERAIRLDADARVERTRRGRVVERYATLSERERQVFAGIVQGRLNKQIAGTLGIAERTVKYHRAAVMHKLGADSVADLVRDAELVGPLEELHPRIASE